MFIAAKLVFESYMPEKLTRGMWFRQHIKDVIYGKIYEYDRIFELQHTPQDDQSYIDANGYPVKPVIMSITANPDERANVLATSDKIGWWDNEPWNTDEDAQLRDIELKDINVVLSDYDGELDIEVQDAAFEEGIAVPIIYMDKVTLRFLWEDDESYDEDEYDDEEDWDDMDDLSDDEPDSAGFTSRDRDYNIEDHNTE